MPVVKKEFKSKIIKAKGDIGPSKTAIEAMVSKVKRKKEWKANVSVPMDKEMRERWFSMADNHRMSHADLIRIALEYAYNSQEFHDIVERVTP